MARDQGLDENSSEAINNFVKRLIRTKDDFIVLARVLPSRTTMVASNKEKHWGRRMTYVDDIIRLR